MRKQTHTSRHHMCNGSPFLRTLAVLLVAVILLGTLIGCSKSDSELAIEGLEAAMAEALKKIEVLQNSSSLSESELDSLTSKHEEMLKELEALKESNEDIRNFIEHGDMFIVVNGKWVDPYNAHDVMNDGGSISYDADSDTLVLTNAKLSLKDNFITAYNDLSVKLVGENVITLDASASSLAAGIVCCNANDYKDLSISGDGTLELVVTTSEATQGVVGITASDCRIASTVSISTGDAVEYSKAIEAYGIQINGRSLKTSVGSAKKSVSVSLLGDLNIYDGSLVAEAGEASVLSEAIYVTGNMLLNYSSVQAISDITTASEAYDIRCLGSIQLFGISSLKATNVKAINGVWDNNGYPNEPIEKIKIYIDQGHNPTSRPNAGAEANGYYEQDITYTVGHLLARLLAEDGRFEVRLSRPTADTVLGTDNTTSLEARVQDAKDFGADYFISIHANAYELESVTGAETFVPDNGGAYNDFARALLTGLVEATGLRDRGVKVKSYYVIENVGVPATLIELGFITNSSDAKLMGEQPELFANGMYNGILSYFNFAKK